ncbi:MAG: TIGR01244 family phosphatase [Silicimonas sp.]|nr:TIGR01244 family phosphatase [Silicimonas sp.]
MDIRQISDLLSVSPQITEADLSALRDAGFRSIICNRPDGEEADQPTFQKIATAAKKLGIEARHIPVAGGMVSDADAAAFRAALDEMPKPILAYCRSGTRSATLWALARADELPLAAILGATQRAGYDMSCLVPRISDRLASPEKISVK